MRKFLKFLAVGSFFATVEEFLTVVVIRRDFGSYLFTLLVLFPVFLTFVWFSSRAINSILHDETTRELAHFAVYGFIGLMLEWFLIGLAPWSDPGANPLLMCLFQLGIFSFWANVGFMPRLFVSARDLSRRSSQAILRFYIPYFLVVYVIAGLVPSQMKFNAIIGLIVLGYLTLDVFVLGYFRRSKLELVQPEE